jgi:hypothetical protein
MGEFPYLGMSYRAELQQLATPSRQQATAPHMALLATTRGAMKETDGPRAAVSDRHRHRTIKHLQHTQNTRGLGQERELQLENSQVLQGKSTYW